MKMLLTLKSFEKKYEKVMEELSLPRREVRLVELMEEMEGVFRIPKLLNTDWERLNPEVAYLYNRIKNSRVF